MKSRGKNYNRLNKKQKSKIDKTVKRMGNIRKEDNCRMRKIIKEKLEWAIEQKKKNEEAINNWEKNIQIYTKETLKLSGIILVLTQLLKENNIKKEK